MAVEAKPQPAPVQIPAMPAPETQSATQFMIAATPAELLLTVGKSRVVFNQTGHAGIHPEWIATFSLGPVAAKQLAVAMASAVAGWEKEAGMQFKIAQPIVRSDLAKATKVSKKSAKK